MDGEDEEIREEYNELNDVYIVYPLIASKYSRNTWNRMKTSSDEQQFSTKKLKILILTTTATTMK